MFDRVGDRIHENDPIPFDDGVKREGVARSYWKINGNWQDHALYGIVKGDPINPPRSKELDK